MVGIRMVSMTIAFFSACCFVNGSSLTKEDAKELFDERNGVFLTQPLYFLRGRLLKNNGNDDDDSSSDDDDVDDSNGDDDDGDSSDDDDDNSSSENDGDGESSDDDDDDSSDNDH